MNAASTFALAGQIHQLSRVKFFCGKLRKFCLSCYVYFLVKIARTSLKNSVETDKEMLLLSHLCLLNLSYVCAILTEIE